MAKGDVKNLTSAANIWVAAAVGIASGAGQFALVGIAFGLLILTGGSLIEKRLPGSPKASED
ncbi:hypothetical protein [Terrihabitans sp. B22-R8]|uniref:hypothetical protein n=1 Tax=Terrihabitans sp. B22-R8 TaxID=3425128 RepID=UPI00403D0CA2